MAVYSVHVPAARLSEPEADAVFVRSGFSAVAVVFGVLWFAWHKMWLALALYVGLLFAFGMAAIAMGLHPTGLLFAQSLIALGLGFLAEDIRRWHLERGGMREIAITSGQNFDAAEIRYYQTRSEASVHVPEQGPLSPSPATRH